MTGAEGRSDERQLKNANWPSEVLQRSRRKALSSALSGLNDRERRIFEARRLAEEPITLQELADEFGVSRERVGQIGVSAFER
jgi:RNA polymerase sigma-32 factor